jgi:Golgi phosphoprotein 3
MLSILEQVVLLALDEQTGKLQSSAGFNTGYALAGAAFFDLALAKKIDTDVDSVQLLDTAETGNAAVDFCLAEMRKHPEKTTVREWIEELMLYGEFLEDAALKHLIERGVLRHETSKLLWVIDVERFPLVDEKPRQGVKLRLVETILSDEIPVPEDVMLVSIAEASGLLNAVLSQQELDGRQDRIRVLCNLEAISRAVFAAIRDLDLHIRSAVMTSY